MREVIRVTLCGMKNIIYKDKAISFPYKKAEGLFCFLCVKKRATREELINMFWSDCSEETARKNLRDALYKVKKAFDEEILLSNNKNYIELNNKYNFQIDVEDILKNENVNSYCGEFLNGFYIKNCENFNDWKELFARELQSLYIQKISEKIQGFKNTRDIRQFEQYVSIFTSYDPYDEEIYRYIMKIYAKSGKYNKGIKVYYDLVKLLKKDLGIEPEPATKDVYKNILKLRNTSNDSVQRDSCFHGRYKELYAVSSILSKFEAAEGKSIMIFGESGIGKTSFLNKIQDMIDEKKIIVLRSSCYSAEESFYLKPWSRIFENIKGVMTAEGIKITGEYSTIINKVFPNFSQNNSEYSQDYSNMFNLQQVNDAVMYLFKRLSEIKKLILIFDDIQWMDTAGKNLLINLLNHIGNHRVILIACYREDYKKDISSFVYPMVRDEKLLELKLNRFSRNGVRALAEKLAPAVNWTETLIDKVYKDTEGNLLFLTELIKLIKIKGYTKDLSLKSIHIIESRLKGLSDKELKFLQALSVFYDNADMDKLMFLLELNSIELFEIIESLQDKYLIEEVVGPSDINYRFTHQKIRDYIYSMQCRGKLEHLHQKVGEHLEERLQNNYKDMRLYSNLIYHFENSKNIQKSVEYRLKNVAQYTNFSIELFPIMSPKEASMGMYLLNIDDELKQIENQLNLLKDDTKAYGMLNMEYSYLSGKYHIYMGEYSSGLGEIKTAIHAAQKYNHNEYLQKCYRQMIYYGIQVSDTEILKSYIDKSMGSISDDRKKEEMATLYRFRGVYHIKNHEYSQAEDVLYEAIRMFEYLEDNTGKYVLSTAACYNYLGQININKKDYKKAFDFFKESIDMCESKNIIKGLDLFYTNVAQVMYEMSRYDECEEYLNIAFSYYDKLYTIWGREIAEGYASLLALKRRYFDAAYEHFIKSEQLARKINNPFSLDLVNRIKTELHD